MDAPEDQPKIKIACWLRAAMARNAVSHRDLADACGVSKSTATKWLDPEEAMSFAAYYLCLKPHNLALDLVSRIGAEKGFAVAPESSRGTEIDHRRQLSRTLKDLSDVGNTYAHVLSTHEGRITNDELQQLEREIREAQEELSRLVDWIQSQKTERRLV